MARPFAVFDIDGTLIRWQLYHAIVDQLAQDGHISKTAFANVQDARMTWKERAERDAFSTYEHKLVNAYDATITQITSRQLEHAIAAVFKVYHDQTYTYTRRLIHSLQEQGYMLFALSASQIEIVELLAKYYGFDDWGGSVYERNGQYFTGNKQVLKRERKPELLKELIAKHDATLTNSIGIGDSDSDIPMLSLVEQPIAFNPNYILFDHAKTHGWKIVIERKNMIYELEAKDGTYLLAQTNS